MRVIAATFLLLAAIIPCQDAFAPLQTPLRPAFRDHHHQHSSRTAVSLSKLKPAETSDECHLDDDVASDCLSLAGYTPTCAEYATVMEVFVAEIESLGDRFESFSASKTNKVKYNKRQKKGQHAFANSSTIETNGLTNGGSGSDGINGKDDDDDIKNRQVANLEYNEFVSAKEIVLVDTVRKPGMQSISRAFPRAGPREHLHFNPSKVNAAIVTCGGLCPGMF